MTSMSETRDFPIAVIASLSTGVLLCDFSKMQEAATYLMGWPIFTHHFADRELHQEMKKTIAEQCPGVPQDAPEVNGDNYREYVAKLEAEFGPTIKVRKGSGLTARLPTDELDPYRTIAIRT